MDIVFEKAHISFRGGREYNEDSIRCNSYSGAHVIAVADGLGGHSGGQLASAIVTESVTGLFIEDSRIDPEHIRSIFERANADVLNAQTPALRMRSTGVALFVNGGACIWGHAGDSRLYLFEDGSISARTIDHSVSQMAVSSGEITEGQIRNHPDRNRVLRSFGEPDNFRAEISQPWTLPPGLTCFLLCTDGFWEYVRETEMEIDLAKAESPREWLRIMLRRLSGRVPEGHDNFSAAAAFVYR